MINILGAPMSARNIRNEIIEILEKHPEGLTLVEIEKIIGVSKHTVAKYIYQLVGEGLIYQREVGTAKLCYLVKK
ncbi:MAG: helix-turn-helix domain-containing protein [Candidatus Aenigmatarchaeota archaeon]